MKISYSKGHNSSLEQRNRLYTTACVTLSSQIEVTKEIVWELRDFVAADRFLYFN
jgi:hypothetical protein